MSKSTERLVVAGAVGVFVAGTLLGANLVMAEPEPVAEEATCEVRTIAQGQALSSNLVMVHVYNGSKRAGLANRVKINLERRGFLGGVAQNNPGRLTPKNVAVLTDDPQDPRVRLVAAQFKGKVQRIKADFPVEDGVSVLVGSNYQGLKKAGTQLRANRAVKVCVPTIELP
ncbi:LytR C-terminal domain-containing protein [Aeromicrobium sp. 179-A 4D2 NHS]|uniref:LytR C-terminal domain-containing protein n=1 Tax=Aeromicrobium sp. 179-A 4D2 NHS TaxID=3142375 RepID=UPI0039A14C25